jgi:hypothetical protein
MQQGKTLFANTREKIPSQKRSIDRYKLGVAKCGGSSWGIADREDLQYVATLADWNK